MKTSSGHTWIIARPVSDEYVVYGCVALESHPSITPGRTLEVYQLCPDGDINTHHLPVGDVHLQGC